MKRPLLIAVLIITGFFVLSCGGTSEQLSLNVQPASAQAFTITQTGTFQTVTLTATLSNGVAPTGVQWTTSQACVGVGNNTQNTTTVACNLTCGPTGTLTATITAAAQGLTGMSSVTCTWQ